MNDADRAQDWQAVILDHSHFPRAQCEVVGYTHRGGGDNPLCGDRVEVQLRVNDAGRIEDVGCLAVGCAISIASASMLAACLKGLTLGEAQSRFEAVHGFLLGRTGGKATNGLGDVESLQLVRNYPSRVKCASLAWHALKHAIDGDARSASTE